MKGKKNILLLTTGGTIASVLGGEGLEPHRSDVMDRELNQLRTYYTISVEDVMCLDSSNMQPEQWQTIARQVFAHKDAFDGIVISHGTDTMAYSASAVTFMLPNIDVPVVFTGSQLPLADILSDGPDNLRTAFAMAASGAPGVFLAFDRKVMLGCRAVKVRASGFSAFESINARYAGKVSNQGLVLDPQVLPKPKGEPAFLPEISENVFLLKLTPGLNPKVFDMLAAMGYKGIVVEAFGLGGINVLQKGLSGIQRAIEDGISVVVTTQCLYDSSDLNVYQVGNKLLQLGVIQGRDMTSEAAMTKLMWAIGQGMTQAQIADLFTQNLAGEITLPGEREVPMGKFEAEVKEKWGKTPAYAEYEEKTKDYSGEKQTALAGNLDAIMAEFALCKATSTPESGDAQALVQKLQAHITENYYTCTPAILAGLGQMYVADPRFKANIDRRAEGTAQFICDAILAYCHK